MRQPSIFDGTEGEAEKGVRAFTVTQVLAAIIPECAFLAADRRLTYANGPRRGRVFTDDECKVVSLCHVNAIGYTGLAKIGRVPTHEWIATILAKAGCHFASHASEVLRKEADIALAPYSKRLRRHAFLVSGWAQFEPGQTLKPHLGLVSNFHDDSLAPVAEAFDTFTIRTRILAADEPVVVFGIGEPLDRSREVDLLRSIRRAMNRDNSYAAVLRLLAEEIFLTSAHAVTVGDRVQACCIPRASATSFFSGNGVRFSGLRARLDRSTFSYFDRAYNEYEQFGPTQVCGEQAISEVSFKRSRNGPDTSMSFRVLHAPTKKP
jgi:hypothetical protein